MKILNLSLLAFTAAGLLTVSTAAQAQSANPTNTTNAFLANAAKDKTDIQTLRLFDVSALPLRGERYLGSTRTATLFYKKGVKNFEKGRLDKAEQHFRAVLRADGSKGLDKATYHYLANIKHKQGDEVAYKKYAMAYYKLK